MSVFWQKYRTETCYAEAYPRLPQRSSIENYGIINNG